MTDRSEDRQSVGKGSREETEGWTPQGPFTFLGQCFPQCFPHRVGESRQGGERTNMSVESSVTVCSFLHTGPFSFRRCFSFRLGQAHTKRHVGCCIVPSSVMCSRNFKSQHLPSFRKLTMHCLAVCEWLRNRQEPRQEARNRDRKQRKTTGKERARVEGITNWREVKLWFKQEEASATAETMLVPAQ